MTEQPLHPMTLDSSEPNGDTRPASRENAVVDCGWGRLLFAHTFENPEQLLLEMRHEKPGKRDIAMYVTDPHIIISLAPQELFLDPSHAFRLDLNHYESQADASTRGFRTRLVESREDAEQVHNLYRSRQMVPPPAEFVFDSREKPTLYYLVAEDPDSGRIIGAVTGIDHVHAYDDPHQGSSLWALAVDAQAQYPGIGETLTRKLAEHFKDLGRHYMDLSVMHDNRQAIRLYRKLGFTRIDTFAVKYKNAYNEPLFIGEAPAEALNPYAKLIVREAQRRGIGVRVLDAEEGYFELQFGGRSLVCRESLSELTHAIAMSRCDNKVVTQRILREAGLRVPEQMRLGQDSADAEDFLTRHGSVVVKPARGEQGQGISVDIRHHQALHEAIGEARHHCDQVIIEEFVEGQDLRIIVIGFEVVAAAVRRPPVVIGTGSDSIRVLIDKQSRRRQAATGGESRIPLDAETVRCVELAGYELDDILPYSTKLQVRRAANLHTGGTIHDVTARLHPTLREAAIRAAEAIDIPVTGLDFLVPDVAGSDYVIIEANERPGLANHEPQPTAERFIDLLFPQTVARI